jgi:hypothetical protein
MTAAPALTKELSHDRTVARSLVHVRALSEIFISDSARDGADSFVAGVQLPRTHGTWGDRLGDHHDPVVTLEVGRQAVFLDLHHYYEVPTDWKFVLRRVDFRVVDLEAFRDDRVHPPEGFIATRLLHKTEEHGHLDATFSAEVVLSGRAAMALGADITVLSPYNYTLLRAKRRGRKPPDGSDPLGTGVVRLPPAMVGRADPRNVVIYDLDPDVADDAEVHSYGLVVDEGHPSYFDHPHDHVTGSLILEFCRQAAIATARRVEGLAPTTVVTGCSMRFEEFAELDSRSECRASVARVTAAGDVLVDVDLIQFGEQIARVQLWLSELPGG